MSNDLIQRKSQVELILAKGTDQKPEVRIIKSPDQTECIELLVFDGRHLVVAGYDLIQTPRGITRELKGFNYLFRCIDDVMIHAVRHYGEIIAARYQERLLKVKTRDDLSLIVNAAS